MKGSELIINMTCGDGWGRDEDTHPEDNIIKMEAEGRVDFYRQIFKDCCGSHKLEVQEGCSFAHFRKNLAMSAPSVNNCFLRYHTLSKQP